MLVYLPTASVPLISCCWWWDGTEYSNHLTMRRIGNTAPANKRYLVIVIGVVIGKYSVVRLSIFHNMAECIEIFLRSRFGGTLHKLLERFLGRLQKTIIEQLKDAKTLKVKLARPNWRKFENMQTIVGISELILSQNMHLDAASGGRIRKPTLFLTSEMNSRVGSLL